MIVEIDTFIAEKKVSSQEGVIYLSDPIRFAEFEKLYISTRMREDRLYPDDVVRSLPIVDNSDPHRNEWRVRSLSTNKLLDYLSMKEGRLSILEVGCGNGWLSNKISTQLDCRVYAIDINKTELVQAARAFGNNSNLSFLYGNAIEDILPVESFDIILLASSVQYFSNLKLLSRRLGRCLDKKGEIHICDSPFYTHDELPAAKRRSIDYFDSLGVPEMAGYYFHHTLDELAGFNIACLYQPGNLINRLKRISGKLPSPFPWFKLTSQ